MTASRALIISLVAVFLAFAATHSGGDAMAECQSTHSFEVCFDALN